MAEQNPRAPRPRPVDVLFGEEVELEPKPQVEETASQPPGYMVESPRPVTTVQPPPPELPQDKRAATPAAPARADATVYAPRPTKTEPKPETGVPDVAGFFSLPVNTATAPGAAFRRQGVDPMAIIAAAQVSAPLAALTPPPALSVTFYGQTELVALSQFVDQLYRNVAEETSDSAALNSECMAYLQDARAALDKREYSKAEHAAEVVKSRLLRARSSRAAATSPTFGLLFGWLVAAVLIGAALFALPQFLRLVPDVVPLLRGIGLGLIGGAVIPLWQIPRLVIRREYDAALTSKFALSPVLGAVIGAVMYLLSLLGLVAAPGAVGMTAEPYGLMYLFALLGGIFNDAIFGAIRGIVPAARNLTR